MKIVKILKQKGAVLFVGLMMLLIMSLIAITSMQGSTLEVRMAGNTKDSLIACKQQKRLCAQLKIYLLRAA